jgi:dimethylglycine catabolism B
LAVEVFGSTLFLVVYVSSLASILAVLGAFLWWSKKVDAKPPTPGRIFLLTKEEGSRLNSKDPVFLMHVAIAVGVGLSILIALLDPFWSYFAILRIILLIISLPLIAGLVAAFVWRLQRFNQSKQAQELLKTDSSFNKSSAYLQLVLILAILLTTSELVVSWVSYLTYADFILNIFRNSLVILYYAEPSINLIQYFDRPLSMMRVPFKLSDVMEGKVDASTLTVGVSKISEFPQYEKLSFDSCVEIGACESACPATAAGRPLSPRIVVRKASLLGKQEGRDPDPFESIREEELWSCVTCGACVQSCPVAVKHLDIIYDLRRNLVNAGKLDKDKSTMLQNLVQNQNPYGFNSSSRADWARDQGIDTVSSNPNADYLYWVGCISSFDQRAQSIAKALSKIMKKAGISFAILGTEEMCNGDPARRLGEEGRYQELAYQNIERLNGYKVRKIITSCPHCFNTIKNEYPAFGGNYEVIYHSQLISNLIRDGRIKLSQDKLNEISVTLHDACYAARYNSIFDEPRSVLSAATSDLREMHRRKEKTFCCGAGGSNYWYKVPQQRTITSIRTEEALGTRATTLATECPFCLSMFEDSMRVNANSKMAVKDLAEIVAAEMLAES